MTKLCPRGKAAAKRKFKVYPSAYANAYASKICAGKIKDPSGVKRKDFRGPKPSAAKVGMAVTAGSQSATGRLQKSGLQKAKKGKMMIMIAIGKPQKANKGLHAKTKKVKQVDPRKGLEFKKGRPPKGTSDHLGNPVVVREASKGRMFTAAQVRALDESTGPKVNPKKKERIMQSGDKDKIKLSKTNLKRYSTGMSYKDMEPYGGKYAKKKAEMTAQASENVKRLTTQPAAYDPETRYIVASQRRGDSQRRMVRKTTDQVNLREEANKLKSDLGKGTRVGVFTRNQALDARLIRPERARAKGVKRASKTNPVELIKEKRQKLKKFSDGGIARGMGAAIKGGKFEGVF